MAGLDLGPRWGEVVALVRAVYGPWIDQEGWDLDDVCQELATKLLAHESRSGRGFRPRADGSGWSSWICLATKRLLINRQVKDRRRGRYHGLAYGQYEHESSRDGRPSGADDPASVGSESWDADAHAEWMDLRSGREEPCDD